MSVYVCGRIRPLGRINVPEHSPCALRAQGHINMLRLPLHRMCVHSKEHTPLNIIFSRFKTLCSPAKVFIFFRLKASQIDNSIKITFLIMGRSRAKSKQSERFGPTAGHVLVFGVFQRGVPFHACSPLWKINLIIIYYVLGRMGFSPQ